MADELDSGSSVGNYVWVQVPSPAWNKTDDSFRWSFCFIR